MYVEKSDILVKLLDVSSQLARSAKTPEESFQQGLKLICRYYSWPVGHVYVPNEAGDELTSTKIWYIEESEKFNVFKRVTEATDFKIGVGLPGRVLESGAPAWIVDVTKDPNFPRAEQAADIGVKAAFAFPILVSGQTKAVWEFYAESAYEPDETLLTVMDAVSSQIARVIERFYAKEYKEKTMSITNRSESMVRTMKEEVENIDVRNRAIESALAKITTIIGNIKFLSLNARIEAGRLGKEAAGFHVVADEIELMTKEITKAGEVVGSEVISAQKENELLVQKIREISFLLKEVQQLQA